MNSDSDSVKCGSRSLGSGAHGAIAIGAVGGAGWLALQIPHVVEELGQHKGKVWQRRSSALEFSVALVTLGAMGYAVRSYRQDVCRKRRIQEAHR